MARSSFFLICLTALLAVSAVEAGDPKPAKPAKPAKPGKGASVTVTKLAPQVNVFPPVAGPSGSQALGVAAFAQEHSIIKTVTLSGNGPATISLFADCPINSPISIRFVPATRTVDLGTTATTTTVTFTEYVSLINGAVFPGTAQHQSCTVGVEHQGVKLTGAQLTETVHFFKPYGPSGPPYSLSTSTVVAPVEPDVPKPEGRVPGKRPVGKGA